LQQESEILEILRQESEILKIRSEILGILGIVKILRDFAGFFTD